MDSDQGGCIVADPGNDLTHLDIQYNSEPVFRYQDSTLIGFYGPKPIITVSRQNLKTGYWISDSLDQDISPEQKRLDSGFHNLPVSKPYRVSYDAAQTRYWVDTPRDHFVFSERTQALCWASIMKQTGLREVESLNHLVPVEIATLGQPYIAAYLHAIPEYSDSKIAEIMGVTEYTAIKYYSEVPRWDGFREGVVHNDLVPAQIAALGQPYIAAYLHVIPECSNSKIAEMMMLSESTVSQYLSDAAGMRR